MYCKFCGKQIPNDSRFCPSCGGTVADATPEKVGYVINGVEIDPIEISATFKLFKPHGNGINAAKYIKQITNCSLSDAVKHTTTISKNPEFAQKGKELFEQRNADFAAEGDALNKSGTLHCPKCHSKNIHVDKKGYSLAKGIIGDILLGPVGLIAGKHKSNKLRFTCLSCNHQWTK